MHPFFFMFQRITCILALLLLPSTAAADVVSPSVQFESVPEAASIAKPSVQRMVLNIGSTDCETLQSLDEDIKHALLLSSMFMQREGALSKIIGPDCKFLGEVQEIANIDDDNLKLSDVRESLYYLPAFHVVFVSNKAENAIAYGMILDEDDTDPLAYFLDQRTKAEESAELAEEFSEIIANIQAPAIGESASSRSVAISIRSSSSTQTPVAPVPTQPVQVASSASSSQPVLPTALSQSSAAPIIAPTSLEPQQEEPMQSNAIGILLVVLGFIAIGVGIVVLRSRAAKKDSYMEQ